MAIRTGYKIPGKIPVFWVHVAAIFAVAAWGVSFVNTKVLLDNGFTPVEAYVVRMIIAYGLLLGFCHKRIRALNWQHELLFLLCGLCGGSIYFLSENTALLYTSTTNVSLITSTSPLINALLVGIMYKAERPRRSTVIGSIIAMCGVSMVILNGVASGSESAAEAAVEHGVIGDTLSILAAVSWSLYALLLRKLQVFYSATMVTRKTFFYGTITALPFMLLEPSQLTLQTFTIPAVWINLLILSLIASSASFVIWAWVVKRLGAVKAGNYLYFQPIVTMIFGAIVLNEIIGILGIVGCIVTIFGVYAGENISSLQRRTLHR